MASNFIASAHSVSSGVPHAQRIRLGKHTVVADEPEAHGGKDSGPAPYALLLASLAACTAITLEMYAARKGFRLGEVKVDLRLFREDDGERAERRITIGGAIDEEQRARLAEIAEKTPVTKTLKRALALETQVVVTGTERSAT
jgi:putative redox protein